MDSLCQNRKCLFTTFSHRCKDYYEDLSENVKLLASPSDLKLLKETENL